MIEMLVLKLANSACQIFRNFVPYNALIKTFFLRHLDGLNNFANREKNGFVLNASVKNCTNELKTFSLFTVHVTTDKSFFSFLSIN